jgi:hypothetical protein
MKRNKMNKKEAMRQVRTSRSRVVLSDLIKKARRLLSFMMNDRDWCRRRNRKRRSHS